MSRPYRERMTRQSDRDRSALDSVALSTVGRRLLDDQPFVRAELPIDLADRAVSAWKRQSKGKGWTHLIETEGERVLRDRAWALALIGLSILESGQRRGHLIVARLPTAAFSQAVCATIADDPDDDEVF
jgi:hypothetical protein